MENQKAQKIAEIKNNYKEDIDKIKKELCKAKILTNEELRDILFAKEIENFNKIKNENKQGQNLNDYIVSDIIDRLVNEIYEHITTNNCSFDDFKMTIFLDETFVEFFRLNFNIKNIEQESRIISISDYSSYYKQDSVILPPRKQLLNIEPLTRISVRRAMKDEYFKISIFGNKCGCQFQENLGENNKNKQPTLILKKDNDEYNIILNDNNTITISKKDSEENDQQKLIDEIQSKFFQEDETIKTLFENLEYELTDKQMKFYNKIKELLGYKKISVEQPKVKYDLCGMDNYWIGKKTNGRFGCCGW
ncbi:MAG: hypothetical protein IJT15_04050 [Rickettsiales bacterium]|nr:hypothetical protein [Rickettsiales bacterium]